jgi:putative FmdB family regulatory protein
MPIYEYRCDDCDRTSSLFVRSLSATVEPECEHCGSSAMTRLISKVARLKTDGDVLAEQGDGSGREGISDPRQIGRWVERRFEEYGMDVPAETREAIERARQGDLPAEIDDL